MEKRLITAIAVSILIIVMFQMLVVKPAVEKRAQGAGGRPVPAVTVQPSRPEIEERPVDKPAFAEKELEVQTDRYILTFSNVGGSIKRIQLKNYKNMSSGEPLELARIENPREYILAVSDPSNRDILDLADYTITEANDEIICLVRTENFEVIKKYNLHNINNGIELHFIVKNTSSSPKEFNYRIIGASGMTEEKEQDKRAVETTSKINGKIVNFKRPKIGERILNPGAVVWSLVHNKYFSIILKPFVQTKNQFHMFNRDDILVTGVEPETSLIQPGYSIDNKFLLYAGPSSIPVLKEFGHGLEETVNYGFFGGISKALIVIMRLCYAATRNWGLSIILLSIFLNFIMFPLTIKSFKSMQKMQELHPQMEKLKVQYKNNPQKLNKEIMELYKKYGINPLSGCLPMLLQMPIFFALYQALMKSIELRNSPFLWIKDLSSPEAIPIPITLPIIGNTVNILPLVMVAAMVIQQKMSTKSMGAAITEEQKQQQKMMLVIMPIMFGFLFYNMPSGLVLYWSVNTIMTIIEQSAILKKA